MNPLILSGVVALLLVYGNFCHSALSYIGDMSLDGYDIMYKAIKRALVFNLAILMFLVIFFSRETEEEREIMYLIAVLLFLTINFVWSIAPWYMYAYDRISFFDTIILTISIFLSYNIVSTYIILGTNYFIIGYKLT